MDHADEHAVTIYPQTLTDLMAVAQINRVDHREVLADAIETVRQRHLPRAASTATAGKKQAAK